MNMRPIRNKSLIQDRIEQEPPTQEKQNASDALCVCDACGAEVEYIIGCPDGAELCQDCFDAGQH